MDSGTLISIAQASLRELLILASPVLLVAVVVGLLISIVQAVTSIQEQTLTFVPKILAILVLLLLLGPMLLVRMQNFTTALWSQMVNI